MSNGARRSFYRLKRVWLVTAILLAVVWLAQRPVISGAIHFGLEVACARKGLVFEADSLRAGLFENLVAEKVAISERLPNGATGRRIISLERLDIQWRGLYGLYEKPKRWIRRASLDRLDCLLTLRRDDSGGTSGIDLQAAKILIRALVPGGEWPEVINLRKSTVEIQTADARFALDGLNISLDEDTHGKMDLSTFVIQAGRYDKVFGPLEALTAWDGRRLSLANLEFVPGLTFNEVACEFADDGAPSLSFLAHVFGGQLRGNVNFQNGPSGRMWDVAVLGSNITVDALPALLGIPGKAVGRLAEGRFTFRGQPDRPVDAEASLRVLAKDFRWNNRGWDSLEIGANLIHRRLLISNFDLKQKENTVTLNGEISLEEGWLKITESPFLANIRANIRDLGALAGLLGEPLGDASGRLTAEGSVSGSPGSLDGFLGIKAEDATYRGLPIEQLRLEILFRKKFAELLVCEMQIGEDKLNASGNVQIAYPHEYKAALDLKLGKLGTYLKILAPGRPGVVSEGELALKWQGDGSAIGHSGAFDLDVSRFVSSMTPAGLTGRFIGTYSPKNIYFSTFEMQNAEMHFSSRVTLSAFGMNLEEMKLMGTSKPLLEGKAFLPIDPFPVLLEGKWDAAVISEKEVYLEINSPSAIKLPDLVRLAGQNLPLNGSVKLNVEASGPATDMKAGLRLIGSGIVYGEGGHLPESNIEITVSAADGNARLAGTMETEGMKPVTIAASVPFGLLRESNGSFRWVNPDEKLEASAEFPRANLALLRPFLPALRGLTGNLSGKLQITNTLRSPDFNGEATISDAGFYFAHLPSRVEFMNGSIVLEDGSMRFENFDAEVSPGRIDFNGEWNIAESPKPKLTFSLRGKKLPISKDRMRDLLASIELNGEGDASNGTLAGTVEFANSGTKQTIQIRPLLTSRNGVGFSSSEYKKLIAGLTPFGNWRLDIKAGCVEPIEIGDDALHGYLGFDVRLNGTANDPVPTGRISLLGVKANAPAGSFLIEEGFLDFLPDQPWEPFATIEAKGWFANHEVRAFIFGPLNEGKWVLDSESLAPSRPQDLFLLIKNGFETVSLPPETLPPVDFFFYSEPERQTMSTASLRLETDTADTLGLEFVESLDFSPRGAVMPTGAFRSGFEWDWSPRF